MSSSGNIVKFAALFVCGGCLTPASATTFADDLAFLRRHNPAVVLTTDEGRSSIVITPAFQGRVMTSTANGPNGLSHGWLNRPVIERGTANDAGNPYGGEDRFWLAPMGGQFSLFYLPAAEFNDDHWRVPAGLDQGAYTLVAQGADFASFRHTIEVQNFGGTQSTVEVNRQINLLGRPAIAQQLGLALDPTLGVVGFESVNTAINRGEPWRPDTGMPSVWILGIFPARDAVTAVAPMHEGSHTADVNRYFAAMDAHRLAIRDGVVYFRGDGRYRSKFGILPRSTGERLGAYDPVQGLLTIVCYAPLDRRGEYPNGFTGPQARPWEGDVVSSYNNGPFSDTVAPPADASCYELESCSPVKALGRGEAITHTHQTYHFEGTPAQLDPIAQVIVDAATAEIRTALR